MTNQKIDLTLVSVILVSKGPNELSENDELKGNELRLIHIGDFFKQEASNFFSRSYWYWYIL